jgi:NAD(P)-dependent dehydrogenase (short-subunit alcohol dehydrogenase family)
MALTYISETTGSQLVANFKDEIQGKTILVTVVSPGGLGAVFSEVVAKGNPALLVIAGRNLSKVQQTADIIVSISPGVKTKILELDLGSLEGARKEVEMVNSWVDVPCVDVVMNNAGILAVEYGATVNGFERQFGTNHSAPFLFNNLIMEKVMV